MTDDIKIKIVELYSTGKGSTFISKELGLSKPTILKVLNDNSLIRKRDRCSTLTYIEKDGYYIIERICPLCKNVVESKSKYKTIACRNHFRKNNKNSVCKKCVSVLQSGEGNPFYGRKHSEESLIKLSKTLTENPRKFSSSSKPEKIIYDIVKNLNFNVKKTCRINRYVCDIFISELNLIIEYYGDYWHCNPNKYNKDYVHPHKKKTAEEIWKEDNSRIDNLLKLGYILEIVWESDFDSSHTIQNIIKKYVKN